MRASNLSGAWGEALAAEYLRKKRYEIVASGYRCRFGEIDLIARNRRFLVFVEVKLRGAHSPALPREFVDRRKQELRSKVFRGDRCPSCGQALPPDQVRTARERFS